MTNNNTTLAVFAIVSALAMFGVVMVTVTVVSMQLQEAEAAKPPIAECTTFWKNRNASTVCQSLYNPR